MKNQEIANVYNILRSPELQNLRVSFTTHLALRQLSRAFEGPFSDLVEIEKKYREGISPEFKKFEIARNDILKTNPPDLKVQIDALASAYQSAIDAQVAHNAEYVKVLEADVPVSFTPLDPQKYSDLFDSELPNAVWDILSLVVSE